MKVLIQAGKAISFQEVGRAIAKVLERKNFAVLLHRQYPSFYKLNKYCDALIVINLVSPLWSLTYFNLYLKGKNELKGRAVFYGIADGIPKKVMFPLWVFYNIEFVANSQYSKKCLEKAGFKVLEVVPHGVDLEEVQLARTLSEEYRKRLSKDFSNKVIFGFVSNYLPRKGIDELVTACDLLYSKRKDFVVLFITGEGAKAKLKGKPWAYFVSPFGSREHVEILGFLGAIDYLAYSAKCDSFGLPILEAMAMKTPVIHVHAEPYVEFSSNKFNITFPYERESLRDLGDGIHYIFHEYNPQELANAMDYAIDIYLNNKSLYEDMKVKAYEKAKEFEIDKVYTSFIKYITRE